VVYTKSVVNLTEHKHWVPARRQHTRSCMLLLWFTTLQRSKHLLKKHTRHTHSDLCVSKSSTTDSTSQMRFLQRETRTKARDLRKRRFIQFHKF